MTTITPSSKTTIPLHATLLSQFHHGAGTSGNTSLLRTQDVVQPDASVKRIPFLSAASIRHGLRDALAWHLASKIDLEPGSLTKTNVDLLWTGGAVTKTGAKTNLELMRRVEETLPMLNLLGFAAQSDIITGTLRSTDMILVCAENNWRLPENYRTDKKAAVFRGDEFGTRHDQATSPAARYLNVVDEELSTAQMIWDTQILITGAELHGELSLTPGATMMHETILKAAVALWAPRGVAHIGAKTAQGYGQAFIDSIDLTDCETSLVEWENHITNNADNIRELITELGK